MTQNVLDFKMMHLSWPGGPLRGTAQLPASKSESNRALILRALAGGGQLDNLSDAHDTQLMRRLLAAAPDRAELDAEDAGTVMRFLTAFLAVTGWRGRLTGTARMQQRPIAVLVAALRQLGAQIEYEGAEGFPPLRFGGFAPTATDVAPRLAVRGDISSQYISALLLVAPLLPAGLLVQLTGSVGSWPYISMTLDLMTRFGAETAVNPGGALAIGPRPYRPANYEVESDWSAASYWYALVALGAPGSTVRLTGLRQKSSQGDQAIARLMAPLGVATTFLDQDEVQLTQTAVRADQLTQVDFTDCPDLAQTVAVVAAALGQTLVLTGLESLRIKETDRIAALQTELGKFGGTLLEIAPGHFQVERVGAFEVSGQTIATYHDHRMAMAFAPLALRGPLHIAAPEVVRKSYPQFWAELRKIGFSAV